MPRVKAIAQAKDATSAKLAQAYDDVDAQLRQLLARTEGILGDSQGLLDRLHGFGLEPDDDETD